MEQSIASVTLSYPWTINLQRLAASLSSREVVARNLGDTEGVERIQYVQDRIQGLYLALNDLEQYARTP